ncbi:renin receptor-like [Amphiura filiformis]|uniref:renin receptor-like n=1 Tax=Amphiura filiformis TaxID=82378 RepID=UPI003B20B930
MAATVVVGFTELFILSCFLALASSTSTLYVTHIPDCISFNEGAGAISSDEISDVVSVALGFTPSKELRWSGLSQGDLFKRPSANVLVAVQSVSGSEVQPSFASQRKYVITNTGAVQMENARMSISKAYGEDAGVYFDLTSDSKEIKLPLKYQSLFKDLPATLKGISTSLHGDLSILLDFQQGSLNLSGVADTVLFSELQLMKNMLLELSENQGLIQDGVPDLYSFTISGLRAVQTEYGVESEQAKDASRIVGQFLDQFSSAFAALYENNALVEILLTDVESYSRRLSRSILQAATPSPAPPGAPDLNVAGTYDENWPVFFNIFLWLGVTLTITVLAVAHLLWYMDPGDTIIYRMTSQRMKMD